MPLEGLFASIIYGEKKDEREEKDKEEVKETSDAGKVKRRLILLEL